MRRMTRHIVSAVLLSMYLLTGCSKPIAEDIYIEGTDFQYPYYDRDVFGNRVVKGENAVYFTAGSCIYQLDEKTGTFAPLCNKPNCLHEKETDRNRAVECNAYTEEAGIAYIDGAIYFIMHEVMADGNGDVLYKVAGDGSAREKVYQWEGNIVEGWCLHRDVLYYVEHTYDDDNQEHYALKEMKLSGMGKMKPKTIMEPDENVTVYAFGIPKAYGNHLYITVNGTTAKDLDDMQTEEEALKYAYTKTFQYGLQDKAITEIQAPDQSVTQHVGDITFWQGKIVYTVFDLKNKHNYDAKTDVYIADLDGGNAKVLMKDMPQYRWYSSDGTYLYVSDCSECLDKIYHSDAYKENINDLSGVAYDFKMQVDVYDKDMNIVDSVKPPFYSFPTEPAYGTGDRMYVTVEDDAGLSLQYWDKTKLGTYHGDEFDLVEVGRITEGSQQE